MEATQAQIPFLRWYMGLCRFGFALLYRVFGYMFLTINSTMFFKSEPFALGHDCISQLSHHSEIQTDTIFRMVSVDIAVA